MLRHVVFNRNVIIQLGNHLTLNRMKPTRCYSISKSLNKAGSYQCICSTGFKTDSNDPMACIDIDECTGKV